jgi:apoptotic protease-activating factor
VLAAEVLRDPGITGTLFPRVFWISFGSKATQMEIQQQMQALITRMATHRSVSIASVEEGKERLRELFLNDYPKALLVLDDVWSPEVIQAFDIQCRVLVTTRNSGVADNVNGPMIPVPMSPSGFTKAESVEALGKWTGKAAPKQAEGMHALSNGLPLVIAIMGSLLKRRPDRWSHYLEQLRTKHLEKLVKPQGDYGHDTFYRACLIS